MKKTITLLALCLIGSLSMAQQAPAIEWQKCFGGTSNDEAYNIKQTTDGGYIVVGSTWSADGNVSGNHGTWDGWVLKLSSLGVLEWQKNFGGSNWDFFESVQQTTDGGYILTGYTSSIDGDVIGNHGGDDVWVLKLTSSGLLQWKKVFGGAGSDGGSSIKQTSDNGYVIIGHSDSIDGDLISNHGGGDYWIIKLSATGIKQWQKTLGGNAEDNAESIQQTTDGGYILAGKSYSNNGDVNGNHGIADFWVVKLAETGDLQWQKALGGTLTDVAKCILQTPDGGYIVAGYSQSIDGDVTGNHGNADAWMVKLSSLGNLQWQKTLGGTNNDSVLSMQLTSEGGFIVAGYSNSIDGDVTGNHGNGDFWLVKLSTSAIVEWQKCLGGTNYDIATSIEKTIENGYIITGFTNSIDGDVSINYGISDYWVVKLSPDLATSTLNTQALTLYPNPTNGLLQMQTPNNTSFNKIIITDSTGKTVLEQTQNTTQVDVEQLASGLYIIKALLGEEVFVNKFVKE